VVEKRFTERLRLDTGHMQALKVVEGLPHPFPTEAAQTSLKPHIEAPLLDIGEQPLKL
jgi:hypothetical protein